MRSAIADRIIKETSESTKQKVKRYAEKRLKSTKLFNLVEYRSYNELINGKLKKVHRAYKTHLYAKPYQLCKGIKKQLEKPSIFFKILPNKT